MKFVNGAFLILALALVGFGYASRTFNTDDTRKELEAVYAKIDKAIVESDMETLESLLADDYEKTDGDKIIKRPEAVAEMKKSLESVKEVKSCKTTIDKIQQVEGNQIVDYTQVAKIVVVGSDGKDKIMDFTNHGRDWWVKGEDGEWSCVAAERIK
ncbi:MAG: hypothetical protein M3T96_08210 [Acidobacteriota bacterium]|nr:hypothetical protein [Acidobacteriota bacterium]